MTRRALATKPAAEPSRPMRLGIEPRGLQREVAARYIGVSATKFDELVKTGRMPQPRRIDGRKVWDRFALDTAFEGLPSEKEDNPWDDLLNP
jgi:predicted DNA-binding transcriptional regulator AlpA